jgi:hypothetical protein
MKTEGERFSEKVVPVYQITRRRRHKNLKSHFTTVVLLKHLAYTNAPFTFILLGPIRCRTAKEQFTNKV